MNPAKYLVPIDIEAEMKASYLDYSMSVIIGRALPDVRDGLKARTQAHFVCHASRGFIV